MEQPEHYGTTHCYYFSRSSNVMGSKCKLGTRKMWVNWNKQIWPVVTLSSFYTRSNIDLFIYEFKVLLCLLFFGLSGWNVIRNIEIKRRVGKLSNRK